MTGSSSNERVRPVRRNGIIVDGVVISGNLEGQAVRVIPRSDGMADLTVLADVGTFPVGITLRPDEALALAAALIAAAKGEAFLRALTEAMNR